MGRIGDSRITVAPADEVGDRPLWTARATSAVALSATAGVVVTLALLISEADTFGAGRVLGALIVGVWCVSSLFVAVARPDEPLGMLMGLAATVAALALFGAALSVRAAATLDANDWGAAMRAVCVALLPAIGLHLGLGLPDGELRSRRRRVVGALGYVTAAAVAVGLLHDRPDVPLAALTTMVVAATAIAVVGGVARYRGAATAYDRARLWWVAAAMVVVGAVAIVCAGLHALVSWHAPLRGVVVATTVLVPISLAVGASERLAVRFDRGRARRHADRGVG
jgi:hypothetical protein